MHPNHAFAWDDEKAMRAFVRERAFAHIFIAGPGGLGVAHVPLLIEDTGPARFHIAKGNSIVRDIENAQILISVADADFYVSPDWYGSENQVPTWNYRAVEFSGTVSRMDETALSVLLDELSANQEQRLAPKSPWTREKMTPGRFQAMLNAIIGYEMHVTAWRGTLKFNQNKQAEERKGVLDAIELLGQYEAARIMRSVTGS